MLTRLAWYLRQARGLPPAEVLRKAARVLRQEAASVRERAAGRWRGTFGGPWPAPGELARRLAPPSPAALREAEEWVRGVSACYRSHRFDVLGSGWLQVRHGMACPGLGGHRYESGPPVAPDAAGQWLARRINRANRLPARAVWAQIDPGYAPIDWQLDIKSGHRWREAAWHLDITFGDRPGVDVKVPWELARMQHLPQLAWAYGLAAAGAAGFEPPQRYAREVRNQVLDFIACNPPGYGVNWRCTMDVAIRVANWLVACDLLRALGAELDAAFRETLLRSVADHGRFIVGHLEYDPQLRGNHYLANLVGLLFVAAYLPRCAESDTWLAFAVQQLVHEVPLQFHEDGGNAEASTSYHRLSAELVVYATALVLGLTEQEAEPLRRGGDPAHGPRRPRLQPGPLPLHALPDGRRTPFPPAYLQRLERMGEFTLHVSKPGGTVHQVGDNDSGRFLKLAPAFQRVTVEEARARFANLAGWEPGQSADPVWQEQPLDHRHLLAALAGLLPRADFAAAGGAALETEAVRALCGGRPLPVAAGAAGSTARRSAAERVAIGSAADWERLLAELEALPAECRQSLRIPADATLLAGLRPLAYPDFGLYLWRSPRAYLGLRCGPVGQGGLGGHAHHDALALELWLDGRELAADPGSYLYSPLPAVRNAYRSVRAHCAPHVAGREPGRLDLGLFRLEDDARAECLYFGPRGFIGRHRGYGVPVWRVVALEADAIVIRDALAAPAAGEPALRLEPIVLPAPDAPPFSPGYGNVERPRR